MLCCWFEIRMSFFMTSLILGSFLSLLIALVLTQSFLVAGLTPSLLRRSRVELTSFTLMPTPPSQLSGNKQSVLEVEKKVPVGERKNSPT